MQLIQTAPAHILISSYHWEHLTLVLQPLSPLRPTEDIKTFTLVLPLWGPSEIFPSRCVGLLTIKQL